MEQHQHHQHQHQMNTGLSALDELLDSAPPQTIAGMYAVSQLATVSGEWNSRMNAVLRARVQAMDMGYGDDPDAVLAPRWIAFADGVDAGADVQ